MYLAGCCGNYHFKVLPVTLCTHLFFGEDVAFGAGLKWLGDVMLGSESVSESEF